MSVQGKRVLVTGSTRGIGRAAAELFLERGAEVLLHGRGGDAVAAAVASLPAALRGRAAGIAGDLAERAECRRIAAAAGEVDVLVNSAGIFEERLLGEADAAHWQRTMAVNLTAPFVLASSLLPGLRRRRGLVINIASEAGILGYPGCSVYCASKGALIGLTRALAVELGPEVRALCICPGPVETDMMHQSLARTPDPIAARRQWEALTLLGRVGQPREIAGAIVFAASPGAAFATGSVWLVDGGVTAGKRASVE
jgi:NAD(P)-dependent dehydrogenase (short-subunit alcohol dehydrogenase family)